MKTTDRPTLDRIIFKGFTIAALLVGGIANGQAAADPMDEPLITDRPDATESTETIPPGHVQIEAGYTFVYNSEGSDRTTTHTAPEMLWRIGVADNLELRIGWDGYTWADAVFKTRTDGGRRVTRERATNDSNDMSLGFKVKLCEQEGDRPHMGVIAGISVPTGGSGATSGDVDPEVVFLWAYDLTEDTSIAGNIGIAVPTEDGHRFVQTFATLAYGFALTDKWGAYVEYFGVYPSSDSGHDAHSINSGLTYLINKDLQLDVRAGFGINDEADDFFAGAGFAMRF